MLKTNLMRVCESLLRLRQAFRKVDRQIQQYHEATKHACKNCLYFDPNGYLNCALHPESAASGVEESNTCRDWELRQQQAQPERTLEITWIEPPGYSILELELLDE